MQPPPFVLTCLGVPRLLTSGGQEVRVKVKKHLATLIVLAVDGGKIRRDRLVTLLWPTARPDRARGSVATAISFLRAKLGGDAIEPARDWVQLRRGHVALDLDRLTAGEIVGDDFTPPLEVDAFLAGFEINQVPDFDDWRERQHARLLPAVEKALVTLADHARRSGDFNSLGRYADQLLQLNDLSEAGIKARMEAYALSGDRITAIKVYDDWVARLHEELRAVPGRTVEDLANRLRRRGWDQPPSAPPVQVVHTEQWRNQHFVGRTREYRHLYEVWERKELSTTQHVLIKGDSGVGKTTLADRFATALALDGATVARARCFELESSIPYATLGGAIGALLDKPGASATSPEALAQLGGIIPTVGHRYPNLPPPIEMTGESARLRFAESTQELLCALTEEQPVLLVIDDINQSDEASIAVLHFLLRRMRGQRLMVVLTWKSGDPARRYELGRLHDNAADLGLERLDLEPISGADSEALFDRIALELGAVLTLPERDSLLRAAAGFPLALELLLRDWLTAARLSPALAIHAMTSEVVANPDATYQRLAENILDGLSDNDRVVADLAAILDRRVGDLELYQVAAVPMAVTLRTLTQMLDRRALRDTPAGLEWINPSIRAHAYLSIPNPVRRFLHGAVLEELLRRSRSGVSIPGLELAWHSFRAGRVGDGSVHLNEGAAEALRAGAPYEAERALVTAMPEIHPSARDASCLLLAQALQEQARFSESLVWLESVSGIEHSLHGHAVALSIRAAVYQSIGQVGLIQSRLHELLALATTASDHGVRVLAISVAASAAKWGLNSDLRERMLRASEEIPEDALGPEDLLVLWGARAKLLFVSRSLIEAEALLERALDLATRLRIRNASFCNALNGLGVIAVVRGNYGRALDLSRQLHEESLRRGSSPTAYMAAGNVGLCLIRLGRYPEALHWLDTSNHSHRDPPFEAVVTNLSFLAEAAAFVGETGMSRDAAYRLEEAAGMEGFNAFTRAAAFGAANAWHLLGDHDRAMKLAKRGLELVVAEGEDFDSFGHAAKWAALVARRSGEVRSTRAFLRRLLEYPLDLIDRAMTLAGLQLLGDDSLKVSEELRQILISLPESITDQFERFGLLRHLASVTPKDSLTLETQSDGTIVTLRPMT